MSRLFFMEPAPDDGEAMDKNEGAFRTISEVAEEIELPQHVLRFWETRFPQIRPLKRGGGRRYYRPEDVELLRAIRHLLYSEGYTIRGVHRLLKEKGVRAVVAPLQAVAPPHGPASPPLQPADTEVRQHDSPQAGPGLASEDVGDDHGSLQSGPAPSVDEQSGVSPDSRRFSAMSANDMRRLEAVLFELSECRRILSAASA